LALLAITERKYATAPFESKEKIEKRNGSSGIDTKGGSDAVDD
jgi:hypothetical protein